MARRRTLDDMPDDQFEQGGSINFLGDTPMPPTDFSLQPTPDDVEIPGIRIDPGVEPPQGPVNLPPSGGGAGNSERPREVFPESAPRSPFAPEPPPAASSMGGGIDLSLLPQGVEMPQSMEAAPQSTAMAPLAPSPVSAQGMPPASPSSVAPSTPARQPFASPSAIFSAQGPRSVGGRGAGLTGGGLSMPGGPSGAPKPTEEMLRLLRSLGINE